MQTKIIPVILCGGAGSRLWPVSRASHPKPFIQLPDGESLLQKSLSNGAAFANTDEMLIVTNQELFFKIKNELDNLHPSQIKTSFILEPIGRNTAAAIALAALSLADNHDENTILLVLPADHLITQRTKFIAATEQAIQLAKQNKLVVFGISPTSPETAYGYIQANGSDVIRFVEKPDLVTANNYLASGEYLWNSGMFCFSIKTILQELEHYCPNILLAARTCFEYSKKTIEKNSQQPFKIHLDIEQFKKIPDQSIDYALMEHSKNIAVVPCDIGWRDIGSWHSIKALAENDSQNNSIKGHVVLQNTNNCYVQSEDRVVGLVGVDDLIVIDTPDALLITHQNATQDVKQIYATLKKQDHDAHKLHRTVYRPWGSYTILEEGNNFKIKRIEVKPGGKLSLQKHQHRSEHWVVVSGTAKVVNNEKTFLMEKDQSTFITAGHLHRLENPTENNLILIEVQTGSYLGEDDIVRVEDHYGR